jgi:hypothetical protein
MTVAGRSAMNTILHRPARIVASSVIDASGCRDLHSEQSDQLIDAEDDDRKKPGDEDENHRCHNWPDAAGQDDDYHGNDCPDDDEFEARGGEGCEPPHEHEREGNAQQNSGGASSDTRQSPPIGVWLALICDHRVCEVSS